MFRLGTRSPSGWVLLALSTSACAIGLWLMVSPAQGAPLLPCPGGIAVVSDAGDSGPGTLRAALLGGCPVITFTLSTPSTITLTSAELPIDHSVIIFGPGPSSLSISGNGTYRVFNISAGGSYITGLTIRNGSAASGGGINVAGASVTLDNSVVISNTGGDNGGGIYVDSTSLMQVLNSKIMSNAVSGGLGGGGGGGISSRSPLTLSNVTVSNNRAPYSGGISNVYSTLVLSNVTVSGNVAFAIDGQAGGVNSAGTMWITNSTIYSNSAPSNGGGILQGSGNMTLTNVTISGNSAAWTQGGGIYKYGGSVALLNTIVANSLSGGTCAGVGTFTSLGHNLDSTNDCAFAATGDLTSTNPLLGPLGNHGGPTQTMPLFVGSLAIDHIPNGTNGCGTTITTDQRGYPRPINTNCDIGAVEGTFHPLYLPLILK